MIMSERVKMLNILDITEDKIFKTLGKGRSPDFKKGKAKPEKNIEPFDYKRLLE